MEDDRYRQEELRRQEGLRLQAEERRLAGLRRDIMVERTISIIYYLVGALLVLLLIRFILRLLAANPDNQFASVIYGLSGPFMAPFSTLFISPTSGGGVSIFDVNILIAMVAYAVLAWLVGRLIRVVWS